MERVTGIEPVSPAWKASIIALIRHPHECYRNREIIAVNQRIGKRKTSDNGVPDVAELTCPLTDWSVHVRRSALQEGQSCGWLTDHTGTGRGGRSPDPGRLTVS
jgi:hypothetical protein